MSSILCVIRHGQSVWNERNLFTGWIDVPLTEQGKIDSKKAAKAIQDLTFEIAFTSVLKRAIQSLEIILNELKIDIPVIKSEKLNERHYGLLQGKYKDDIIKEFGEEQVRVWRRSFDVKPLNNSGESLEDCQRRIIPFLKGNIFQYLQSEKNVLLVGHGNSLRATIMYIEKMPPEEVLNFDLELTTPYLYHFNQDMEIIRKEVRPINGAHHST